MVTTLTVEDFKKFDSARLKRMAQVLNIAIETPCSNELFLEYCNRVDCITQVLEDRQAKNYTTT